MITLRTLFICNYPNAISCWTSSFGTPLSVVNIATWTCYKEKTTNQNTQQFYNTFKNRLRRLKTTYCCKTPTVNRALYN